MESNPDTTSFYVPFPSHSVNVITGSTNSGKTHLMLHILKNKEDYFQTVPVKTIVVLCNNLVSGEEYEEAGAEVISFVDFDIDEHLQPETLLIFEDVQNLARNISDCINIHAHHSNLSSVFVIVQGILGNDDLFRLLSLTHRIILFYCSSVCTRLSNYLNSYFFQNQELKDYIKQIRQYSEGKKNILLLELNQIQGKNKTKFLAISGLGNTSKMSPPVYFPHFRDKKAYKDQYGDNEALIEADDDDDEDSDDEKFPGGGYVLVPSENVRKRKRSSKGKPGSAESDMEQRWNNTLREMEQDIESSMPSKKWQIGKNILRAIMKTKKLCVSADGKVMFIKDQPKTAIPILDYIIAASRSAGPEEVADKLYIQYTRLLLSSNTPSAFFKNKSLLRTGGRSSSSRPRHSVIQRGNVGRASIKKLKRKKNN